MGYWFWLIIGVLLIGEAFALAIGVFIVGKGRSDWNTKPNRLFLISDIVGGLVLLLNSFFTFQGFTFLIGLVLLLLIFSHFKRTLDYFARVEKRFCANKALFLMNNLKIIILFGALFLVLPI